MTNNLKKDFIWNTIGVFLQNAISPLLLIAITRINGIYDSGIFSFSFSVAIIFWALGIWGGRTYQVSDVNKEFTSRSYLMVRLILCVLLILGAAFFVVVNNYDIEKSSVLITLVAIKSIESVADCIYGVMQVNNRLYLSGVSLIFKSVIGFIGFVLIDILTNDIFLSSIAILLINILIVLLYDIPIVSRLESLWMKRTDVGYYLKQAIQIMKRCAPVFAVMFLAMFSLNIPRYFIDRYFESEVGYFGIIAMPITLIALLMSFILQPNAVTLSVLFAQNKYCKFRLIVKKIIIVTLFIGALILILTTVIGTQILELLFGVNFSNYWLSLVIIVTGGVINAVVSILINILIIMRLVRCQFFTLLFSNVILVVLSAVVIPRFGLVGSAALFASINFIQLVLLLAIYIVFFKNNKKNDIELKK